MILFQWIFELISRLPFSILHRFSDLLFFLIYFVFGYRKRVVLENLRRCFPEKTENQLRKIRFGFYRNFCDLIMETIKTMSISTEEVQKRCQLENPKMVDALLETGRNVNGISSHMGNWEWLSLALSLSVDHRFRFLAVYKPLAMKNLNAWVIRSRERFGARFVAIKELKGALDEAHSLPYFVGLLSDQAPHDYSKAFEFEFLNQKTYFVTGPGVITVQRGLMPVMGWIRRTGRSRYTWKLEEIPREVIEAPIDDDRALEQIRRIAKAHALSESDAQKAYRITEYFVRRLEAEIKMAPQDWLWSHRRWKSR